MDLVHNSGQYKLPAIKKKKANYHHGDLKAAIINAVAKLIEKNYSLDFQLRDIAKMVNTSVPAIYRHFESKQHLLVETAIGGYAVQKSFRDIGIGKSNATSLHKLLAIGFAYVAFARECPGLFLLMKTLEPEEMVADLRYIALREETKQTVDSVFLECVKDGLVKNVETEVAMTFLQSTSLGYSQMIIGRSMNLYAPKYGRDENLLSRIYKLAIAGILTEKGISELDSAAINPFEAA